MNVNDAVQVESEGRGDGSHKPNLLQVQGLDQSNAFSSWCIMEIQLVKVVARTHDSMLGLIERALLV